MKIKANFKSSERQSLMTFTCDDHKQRKGEK